MVISDKHFETVFLGHCLGIGLRRRDNDNHVCVDVLFNDGIWVICEGRFSSFWLNDLSLVIEEAKAWMEEIVKKL